MGDQLDSGQRTGEGRSKTSTCSIKSGSPGCQMPQKHIPGPLLASHIGQDCPEVSVAMVNFMGTGSSVCQAGWPPSASSVS